MKIILYIIIYIIGCSQPSTPCTAPSSLCKLQNAKGAFEQ